MHVSRSFAGAYGGAQPTMPPAYTSQAPPDYHPPPPAPEYNSPAYPPNPPPQYNNVINAPPPNSHNYAWRYNRDFVFCEHSVTNYRFSLFKYMYIISVLLYYQSKITWNVIIV